MGHVGKGYDVNQTFIIESIGDEVPIMSACTGFYTNFITSCSGDTSIYLNEGSIYFSGILETNIISGNTFYSGGTELSSILDNFKIHDVSFNSSDGVLTINQGSNLINITGFTDIYITGVTFSNNILTLKRSDNIDFQVNINNFSGLSVNGPVSATTYFGDGSNLSGISTQDIYVTGFTYSNNNLTLLRNFSQPPLTVNINTLTGLTVNGSIQLNGNISNNTFSGSTNRLVEASSSGLFSATKTLIDAYISSASTAANLLVDENNWDVNGNYTGSSITDTFMGQKFFNNNYFFEAVNDNIWVRLIRG